MAAQKRNKKKCMYCGKVYQGTKLQKYCCNAHKKAAFEQAHNLPIEKAVRAKTRYTRMIATKAATLITTRCCGCGCEMTVTGVQGRGKMYHNAACKQRAARERKAAKENAVRGDEQGNN